MDWGQYTYAIAFYAAAAVAVASAVMVVGHKNPVINALFLVVTMFAVAVIFVLLKAHFLAAAQVLVYAGAALVLFLLIVMLLNLDEHSLLPARPGLGKAAGVAAVFALTLLTAMVVGGFKTQNPAEDDPQMVAAFLISLQEPVSKFERIAPPAKLELSGRDRVKMAVYLLQALDDTEVKEQLRLPDKDKFRRLDEQRLRDLRRDLEESIANLDQLEQVQAPIGFMDFTPDDLLDLIRAAGNAKLAQMTEFGTTATVGRIMFSTYLLPFEAASFLLLAAIVGVLLLARRGPKEEG